MLTGGNMNIINNMRIPENPVNRAAEGVKSAAGANFQEILENRIIFSKHANTRLSSRELSLSPEQLERVETGVTRARQRGIVESLVLIDNLALVVNIKNKLVITAMERESDNIFTNIDGAVIV